MKKSVIKFNGELLVGEEYANLIEKMSKEEKEKFLKEKINNGIDEIFQDNDFDVVVEVEEMKINNCIIDER